MPELPNTSKHWGTPNFTGINERLTKIKKLTEQLMKMEIERSKEKVERITHVLERYRDSKTDSRSSK